MTPATTFILWALVGTAPPYERGTFPSYDRCVTAAYGQVVEASAAAPPAVKNRVSVLHTSIYFHREVHDQLRATAFEKRKSVAGVIHEALDEFLRKHRFPTTEELKRPGAKKCAPAVSQ